MLCVYTEIRSKALVKDLSISHKSSSQLWVFYSLRTLWCFMKEMRWFDKSQANVILDDYICMWMFLICSIILRNALMINMCFEMWFLWLRVLKYDIGMMNWVMFWWKLYEVSFHDLLRIMWKEHDAIWTLYDLHVWKHGQRAQIVLMHCITKSRTLNKSWGWCLMGGTRVRQELMLLASETVEA